jgi:hypothetical protein
MKRLDLIAAIHARKNLHASSLGELEITIWSARPTALVAQGLPPVVRANPLID